ncbi:MAG: diphosphomevalonate/mevalonate 3,5-bisphosphate decarboxylase family protein [Chitinophagales bacterium]
MLYTNPKLVITSRHATSGQTAWQSPSNIALVKYWGKFGRQYPRNTSISFTLNNCHTQTHLSYQRKDNYASAKDISLNFTFEGQSKPLFAEKITHFFDSITDIYPFLRQYHFTLSSRNSFPHSSGIASSASSMSALAMCLITMEQQLFGAAETGAATLQKASFLARLGSGSASRSVYPKAALWGLHSGIKGSANDFALGYEHRLHDVFKTYQDSILVVSKKEKSVSSRAGHALMEGNPYAASRYEQAQKNITRLNRILQMGDLADFIPIVESEALTLHALMMCSTPSFILMHPNTLQVINKLQAFRQETKVPVCFTLDAGPNVHVLYPRNVKANVEAFIQSELLPFCEDGNYWIKDEVGNGATRIRDKE